MAQSLSMLYAHAIFSTKHRRPALHEVIQPGLYAYFAGILKKLECPAILVGGHLDHMHLLFALSKNTSAETLIEEIKPPATKWLKQHGPEFRDFAWQNGYGMFSVSATNLTRVRRYIQNQSVHHRATSFQEEFREFLKRYRVAYDENFVWD